MNKKLLAVAVAAALAAPLAANADNGNVKISGVVHMSVDSLDNGNTRNTNVSSNSSKIVFSGDEALGNGLKAVWEVTSYVRLDNSGSTLADGNTYAGLGGGFGTVLLGKHDTPMKLIGRSVDLFGDQIGDARNLTGANGNDLRANNVIAYASPDFSGFSVLAAYVTNTDTAAASDASTKAWSANAKYSAGPLMLGAAYEKHNVANTGTDPSAWRLAGGYSFGDFKVVALWQNEKDLGTVSGKDQKTWGLGGAYKMGATTLKAQYYKADDVSNTTNTGANMWALGADYALSKRTTTYVAYARTSNDGAAAYSAFGGGHGDNPGIATGKDGSGVSLGMKHSF